MAIVTYDQETNRYMTSDLYQLLEAIMKAKRERDQWEVVDLCVKAFQKKFPRHYSSYVIRVGEIRKAQKETRVGRKYFRGVSHDKENDAYLAHTIDFPAWIMGLIRKVYNVDELKMDKEFFREFGKRHPEFRVMNRV